MYVQDYIYLNQIMFLCFLYCLLYFYIQLSIIIVIVLY